MWYTINAGINNYTFIENGIIYQSAWDAMPDGTVTLTFYASDKPGNIGMAEVSVVKDATAPIIVINSPASSDVFGASAPSFELSITDDYLDSMWYTLDGGLTNYAITTNATIDQTAWTALLEGSITITFYANDTLGNLSFEEVTVTKSIPLDVVDPTIIVVIVVAVSIASGVAIAAVLYIYLKKRASPQ